MSSNQIAETELTANEVKEYNYYVGHKQALDRLETNPDFQKVILEGYFRNEAIRGVSLLANDYMKSQGKRPEIMETLIAISNLQDYFLTIKRMGTVDEEEYGDDEENEG